MSSSMFSKFRSSTLSLSSIVDEPCMPGTEELTSRGMNMLSRFSIAFAGIETKNVRETLGLLLPFFRS
ncbi:hypothetical protein L596_005361 [Steinernema carpocapsae]|uniref:Uncharacterized protein n=1 Tax=Steinernema carpocapsae TaxID=34508 RepID=A0A4U8UYS4_STECR|nr:hypothetical protein L596_005361 [Steinernema carpocapsae]